MLNKLGNTIRAMFEMGAIVILVCALILSGGFLLAKSVGVMPEANSKRTVDFIYPIKADSPKNEPAINAGGKTEEIEVIVLTEDNSVTMDQAFTDQSVNQVMREIQAISNKNGPNTVLYLVMNTPGGSVDAGLQLITFIKALPQKVKTISIFAASMGFQTAQGLDERLILENGTLMSHRARFGVQGQAPGELFTRIKHTMSMLNKLDQVASKRMGMSFDDYRKLIHDEYWVYDQDAVTDKAADRRVLAKCGKGMVGKTKTTKVETMFGAFTVTVDRCPLIPGYLSVSRGEDAKEEGLQYVKKMFGNRNRFVEDYILTNRYMEFQK